ncbi:glycosyltransferase [Thauera sp. WH-2]|uniref:glycosyltransferase n=1 Tax=Thauera sp. WH-2 TaxID=3401574 RepID=UPI003AACF724
MSMSSRFTITLFIPDLEMGGAERVFVTLARQFLQRGHGVRLILARGTGPLLTELDPRVDVIDLAAGPPSPAWRFGLRTLWCLARELRRRPPEVMLSTLTGANLVAIAARILCQQSFPLVVREAVTLPHGSIGGRGLAMRLLYSRADRVVALTEPMAAQLERRAGLDPARIAVIPNPVDHERVDSLSMFEDDKAEIRAWRPYLLAVGRLAPQKGHADLIRALATLPDPPRCVILGEGPERERLERLVRHSGLEERVHMPGVRDNPYPWYRNAMGFVLPSHWEGYPNTLLEAMHFGLPIVATRYDASVDAIRMSYDLNQFHLVACGEIHSLAMAIDELSMPRADAKRCPADACERVSDAANLLLKVLETAVKQAATDRVHG